MESGYYINFRLIDDFISIDNEEFYNFFIDNICAKLKNHVLGIKTESMQDDKNFKILLRVCKFLGFYKYPSLTEVIGEN